MTDLADIVDDLLSEQELVPTPADSPPPRETPEGPGLIDKAKEFFKPKDEPAKKAAAPVKKAPGKRGPAKGSTRRRPLGDSLARVILQVGRMVNTLVDPPTGAAIMFEAGALGAAVDGVIAGTFIDKPLQKGAAVAERFEPLVPLVMLPAMTFMLSKNPAMSGVLEGELREALEDVLAQSLPLLRQRAARTRMTVDALKELKMLDPALADSDDPVGDILNSFFTHPAEPAEPVVSDAAPRN